MKKLGCKSQPGLTTTQNAASFFIHQLIYRVYGSCQSTFKEGVTTLKQTNHSAGLVFTFFPNLSSPKTLMWFMTCSSFDWLDIMCVAVWILHAGTLWHGCWNNTSCSPVWRKRQLYLLSMSASWVLPALGSEPRYVSEPHPRAVEDIDKDNSQLKWNTYHNYAQLIGQ